eukprot:2090709-Pleurochrysis_carterae.AAC.2
MISFHSYLVAGIAPTANGHTLVLMQELADKRTRTWSDYNSLAAVRVSTAHFVAGPVAFSARKCVARATLTHMCRLYGCMRLIRGTLCAHPDICVPIRRSTPSSLPTRSSSDSSTRRCAGRGRGGERRQG